jgi:hypothetical protein
MAIVVIGGQARKVGKTSVVAGLISALREYEWTAVKISQHAHDLETGTPARESADVKEREWAETKQHEWAVAKERDWAISEEHDCSGGSDTSRFLAAGAERALWVRANPGHLGETIPALELELKKAGQAMIESNSIVRFVRPDVYLVVLDPANPDVKESVREFLESADGVIVHDVRASGAPPEKREALGSPFSVNEEKGVFPITPPDYVTPEIIEFVRRRIGPTSRKPGDVGHPK